MNKKIFFVSILLVSTIIFSGCGVKKENTIDTGKGKLNVNQNGDRTGFNTSTFKQVGEKGEITDLQIGKKVTVMGASNSDSSINASRVMIGEMPIMERSSATPERIQAQDGQGISGGVNNGERPNFTGGQNNFRGAGAMGAGGMSVMLNGEILKINETGFILKMEKEGTKIIYVTAGTEIYLISSTTPQMNTTTPKAE